MDKPGNFAELVAILIDLLVLVIPLIFGLTLLFIIYKIFNAWIFSGGDVNKVAEGRAVALTGVIVLIIMSGVWGIVYLLRSSLFGL